MVDSRKVAYVYKKYKKMLAIFKYFATIDLPEADSNFKVSKT
jgi:hypothetical protein